MTRRRSASSVLRVVVGAPAAIVLIASCSYDWTFTPDGGTSGGIGIGSVGDASPPDDGGVVSTKDATTGDVVTSPPLGSCRTSAECGSNGTQYCHFADGSCGRNGTAGTCAFVEMACTTNPPGTPAICSCAGTTVDACSAALKGIDIDPSGTACAPVKTDTFACPGVAGGCARSRQYCLIKAGGAQQGSCIDIANCAQLGCQCPDVSATGCACQEPTAGVTMVTCAP
jgi:hypothetical protein